MRSPLGRFHDVRTRPDSRPFGRVSGIFLVESTPASLCSHRKRLNAPHLPLSLIMPRGRRRCVFSSYSRGLFFEKRRTRSSCGCTKHWLHYSSIRSGGTSQPISSSLGSICISLWGSSSSHASSSVVGFSIATVPSATATLGGRSPRRVARFK